MFQLANYVINAFIFFLVLAGQIYFYRAARRGLAELRGNLGAQLVLILLGTALAGAVARVWLDNFGIHWFWRPLGPVSRGASFAAGIWTAGSAGAALVLLIGALLGRKSGAVHSSEPASPGRREFLAKAAQATAALMPFGAAAYGTLLVRSDFVLREVDFPVTGLPPPLEGLRLALLSDIHFGPYLSSAELTHVVNMANETKPHLTLVTGDLITRARDPLESCLAHLACLRAEAGVFGCLGNHEIYAEAENFAEALGRRVGIEFLRRRSRLLEFGGEKLNLAGVDYQRQHRPYLVGAERMIVPGAVNLLLSHNPDVFPVAANLGYDLVVGGHTHGGQVTVEILEQSLNMARFFTPFVAGLYRRGAASLYVSRGIGTINLPMRLGARPEVALLRLRRA
ncbi:MAG: metallophosphoesterase [Acidobacteria bacterium]|nr:metallophosphoesterase [Acidobacteriota bacterium]